MMGDNKSEKPSDTKPSDDKQNLDIHGLVDEVDESAQTVIFQRAINPDELKREIVESEETKIIHAVDPNAAKKQLSDEELNRIVDEVGLHGAMPMDILPSAVEKDSGKDKKE